MDDIKLIVTLFKVYDNWIDYVVRCSDRHIIWTDRLNFKHESTIETLEKDLDDFERYYVHLMKDDIK